MLKVEILSPNEADRAAAILHRDGFVCLKDVFTPEQLRYAQAGAARVIQEQTDADPERKGNRGHHRYSFGHQTHNPEWTMLVDLPGVVAVLDKVFGNQDYICTGAGGDYSLPKAERQPLHADAGEFMHDPLNWVSHKDLPPFFIVVNFTMVDFTVENGAIRFIPCTHRSRSAIPGLADEPEWMQNNHLCAPAGTAIVRDVRCWHGGTPNISNQIRPMTSAGYVPNWFRPEWAESKVMPRELYEKLSPRGKKMCRYIIKD